MAADLKAAKTKADRADAYKKYDDVVRRGTEARADAYKSIAQAQSAIQDQKREDALNKERAAVDRLVESLERQVEAREQALGGLNRLLDAERDLRASGADAERQHAERVAAIQQRSAQAGVDLQRQQQQLLDDRRDQLDGWARPTSARRCSGATASSSCSRTPATRPRSSSSGRHLWRPRAGVASRSRSSPPSGSTRARKRSVSCASSVRRHRQRSTR